MGKYTSRANLKVFISSTVAILLLAVTISLTPARARADEDYSRYSPATSSQISQIREALELYLRGSHGFGIESNSLRNMHVTENFAPSFVDVEGNLTFSNSNYDYLIGKTGALKAEFDSEGITYLSICDYHGVCDSWKKSGE
jgi:hypothetical protein